MAKIQTVAKTHVGQVRDHNEDTFIVGLDPVSDSWLLSFVEQDVHDKGAVFVVADGMGGENAGEIASEIAVQSIRAFIQSELKKEVSQPINKILESSLIYAHNCIKDACRDNADYIGMGTTATVCMIQNDRLYVSWIGDTRVYRYSKHGRVHALPFHYNNLDILSEDHSKVWQMMRQGQISLEEARTHQESNIITQSLGDLFRTPQPESREYPIFQDDHILICSDGLNGMLSDASIERIFTSEVDTLDKMAEQMITEANLAGGHDNITLILTKVTEGMPYSDEIVKKGIGEKTMMTEALPKKRNNLIFYLFLVAAITGVIYWAYKNKDSWLPAISKKPTIMPKDTTISEPKNNMDTIDKGKKDVPSGTPVESLKKEKSGTDKYGNTKSKKSTPENKSAIDPKKNEPKDTGELKDAIMIDPDFGKSNVKDTIGQKKNN
jgi:protein phosphatase